MAIKIQSTNAQFSSVGGLLIFSQLYDRLCIKHLIRPLLPSQHSKRILKRNQIKFKNLLMGFVAGADCLDDMAAYDRDPGFSAVCKERQYSPTTYGNFMRGFQESAPFHLNDVLIKMALKLRSASFKEDKDFILDIDSTDHKQCGKKMEGLAYNYKDNWGLDSIQAFDQYGFQYWMDVRPGNTHTSVGARTIIDRVFRQVPKKLNRFLRADSGYCNLEVFKACLERGVKFAITFRSNMLEPLKPRLKNWKPCKEITMRDGRKCEIASTVYYPDQYRGGVYRVVVIRARKKEKGLFDDDGYDYRAWVTNIGEHEKKNEAIIKFYQGRGNAENFIRELKNGFDLKHFPCQKLLANKIYGLLGAFSHNLMRYTGWIMDGKVPRFSKTQRFKMVYIACQVVKTGRQTFLRYSTFWRREVERRITTIQHIKFDFG